MTSARSTFTFETASATDVGSTRTINEDTVYCDVTSGIWLVADGMGGHAAGDFASQTVAEVISTIGIAAGFEDLKHRFEDRMAIANRRIFDHATENDLGVIGSTIAAVASADDRFLILWSGDSRVYLVRDGTLKRATRDHTEVQALLDAGSITQEQADQWPRKNVIAKAIGVSQMVDYQFVEGVFQDQDVFLLCSDGLTEYFADDEIEGILQNQALNLDEVCKRMVATSIERGGRDNVSIVLLRVTESALPEVEVWGQFPEFGELL